MIIVFDLDDTLYDEISYVKSSLYEVASYLSEKNFVKRAFGVMSVAPLANASNSSRCEESIKKHNNKKVVYNIPVFLQDAYC